MTVAWQDVTGALLPPLWRASWQAAFLAILVLCVQRLLGPRLPARWRYNLWALVLLRLLLPVTPQAPFSLFNLAPDLATPRVTPAGAVPVAPRIELSPDAAPTERVAPAARPIPWLALLAAAWCFGALVLLARIAVSSVRLARMVRQMSAVTDEGVASLLRGAAADMNVRRPPALLVSRDLAAPALMGFRRPRLLLPAHVLADFTLPELRLIFLHELAHQKRRDVAANWLVAVLRAIHWFNPILWLAFARLRADRELAADEMVLLRTGAPVTGAATAATGAAGTGAAPADDRSAAPGDRADYGDTIVKLLQNLAEQGGGGATGGRGVVLPGTVGILERAHDMRRRITMIAQFNRRGRRKCWTGVAAACMIALGGLALTDAVRGDDAQPAAAQATPAPAPAGAGAAAPSAGGSPSGAAPAPANETTRPAGSGGAFSPAMPPGVAAVAPRAIATRPATTGPATDPRGPGGAGADVGGGDAERLYRLLHKRVPEIRVDQVGFSDVVDFIRDVTGANIVVNWRALEAAGIDRNALVTQRLRDVTLEQALRQVLRDVGGGGQTRLGFTIDGGALVLSTYDDVSSSPRTRAYPVDDLIRSAATSRPSDKLVDLITTSVAPSAWREKVEGARFSISEFEGRLIVNTVDMHHVEIDRMLAELRRAR